jgi:hypothetical protein
MTYTVDFIDERNGGLYTAQIETNDTRLAPFILRKMGYKPIKSIKQEKSNENKQSV